MNYAVSAFNMQKHFARDSNRLYGDIARSTEMLLEARVALTNFAMISAVGKANALPVTRLNV
ncbi:MAG: hypothetical protein QXY52_07010 [Conexivisphaerales archaeon]